MKKTFIGLVILIGIIAFVWLEIWILKEFNFVQIENICPSGWNKYWHKDFERVMCNSGDMFQWSIAVYKDGTTGINK